MYFMGPRKQKYEKSRSIESGGKQDECFEDANDTSHEYSSDYGDVAAIDGRTASDHDDGHGQYGDGYSCGASGDLGRIAGGFDQCSGDSGFLCYGSRRYDRLCPILGASGDGECEQGGQADIVGDHISIGGDHAFMYRAESIHVEPDLRRGGGRGAGRGGSLFLLLGVVISVYCVV